MRAEFHLARRYLIGLRRRTHVATVTLISLVGLALVFASQGPSEPEPQVEPAAQEPAAAPEEKIFRPEMR